MKTPSDYVFYKPINIPKTNERFPLAKRLRLMLETNETNTETWKRTLKWNNLTHEQAIRKALGSS